VRFHTAPFSFFEDRSGACGSGAFHVDLSTIARRLLPRASSCITMADKVRNKLRRTMTESTITAKGQTTVPAAVRALVRVKPGTRLTWSVAPDGTILVRAKTKSILDMAGAVKAPKGKRVKLDAMNPWR
jgi:antitoxin PrlF